MIANIIIIFSIAWCLLVIYSLSSVIAFLLRLYASKSKLGKKLNKKNDQSVLIITSIDRIIPDVTSNFFNDLFDQNYSNYRIIVTFKSWDDESVLWLKNELNLTKDNPTWYNDSKKGLISIYLHESGISKNEVQKIHNQNSSFSHIKESDDIIVFVDSNIILETNWLTSLVSPINTEKCLITSTYRVLIPKNPFFMNIISSVINFSILNQISYGSKNVIWRGSVAISKSLFNIFDFKKLKERKFNDNFLFFKSKYTNNINTEFIYSLIRPLDIDFSWSEFINFWKNHYTQIKLSYPSFYIKTNLGLIFYLVGIILFVYLIIKGYFIAWIPVIISVCVDQFRAMIKQKIYLILFEDEDIRLKISQTNWMEHAMTPIWKFSHLCIVLNSWFNKILKIDGVTYEILSKSKLNIKEYHPNISKSKLYIPGIATISPRLRNNNYIKENDNEVNKYSTSNNDKLYHVSEDNLVEKLNSGIKGVNSRKFLYSENNYYLNKKYNLRYNRNLLKGTVTKKPTLIKNNNRKPLTRLDTAKNLLLKNKL